MTQSNDEHSEQEEGTYEDEGAYEGKSSKSLRELNLEVALRQRRSGRQRLLLVGVTCLVCALAVIPLWRGLMALRLTPPGAPDSTALVVSNVPIGVLTLDGRRVASHSPSLIKLHGGTNKIGIAAAPFQPHSCLLTVPKPSSHDTCRDPSGHESLNSSPTPFSLRGKSIQPTYVVNLSLGLDDLPPPQGQQVMSFLTKALQQASGSFATTVPPGQYYAASVTDHGISMAQRATGPLQAMPEAMMSPPGSLVGCAQSVCPTSVELQNLDQWLSVHEPVWAVDMVVQYGWRFSTQSGAVVGQAMFLSSTVMPLNLAYDPSRGWRLAQTAMSQSAQDLRALIPPGLCQVGNAMLTMLAPGASTTWLAPATTVEGCRIEVQNTASGAATPATNGIVLWRFGALLAADTHAHALFPQLPVASAAEIAAVAR